jgi:CoA-binding domain
LPVYGFAWLLTQVFVGGYDKPIKLLKNIFGGLLGTSLILIVYALLSKDYQFSRLIILLGGAWVILYYLISRIILHYLVEDNYRIGGAKNKRFAIIGDVIEVERVNRILQQTNSKIQSVVYLSAGQEKGDEKFTGTYSQLDQAVDIHEIDEVIFCAKNISAVEIIGKMLELEGRKIDFKIAQPETSFLIGSNSIDSQGDLYVMDINRINKPENKRNKRLIDIFLSFFILLLSPLLIWIYHQKSKFLKNLLLVFFGKLSFVGYTRIEHSTNLKLPNIKRGILSSIMMVSNVQQDDDAISRLNLIYAKNHSFVMDLKIVFRNLGKLDS